MAPILASKEISSDYMAYVAPILASKEISSDYMAYVAPILASKEISSHYMAYRISSRPSPGHELSFGSSFTSVGQLGTKNDCYLSHYHIVSYYITLSYRIIISYLIIISGLSCYKAK